MAWSNDITHEVAPDTPQKNKNKIELIFAVKIAISIWDLNPMLVKFGNIVLKH